MTPQEQHSLDLLVIDDTDIMRDLLKDALELIGLPDIKVKVDTASDGLQGLEMYRARRDSGKLYDGVLTDLSMPKACGDDVLEGIRKIDSQVPVYLITGAENTGEYANRLLRAKQFKPDRILHKPISMDIIPELIREISAKKVSLGYTPPQQKPEAYQS